MIWVYYNRVAVVYLVGMETDSCSIHKTACGENINVN